VNLETMLRDLPASCQARQQAHTVTDRSLDQRRRLRRTRPKLAASGLHREAIMNRPIRSVVAVSGNHRRAEILETLFADEYVFVEPITRAYARIRQVTPDVVVIYCEIDDEAACQLLSMLKVDPDLSRVPVLTYTSWFVNREYVQMN
jgi:hypothetical protein